MEWLAGCFAVLAGAAVAPLGHNDISTKIYIMKLPATALTQNFSTTTKMCFLQHQNHFPTRFLCESSSIQLYVGRFVTFWIWFTLVSKTYSEMHNAHDAIWVFQAQDIRQFCTYSCNPNQSPSVTNHFNFGWEKISHRSAPLSRIRWQNLLWCWNFTFPPI